MKEVAPPVADVGVIVGRFQVHELHQAHRDLIDHVSSRHSRTLVFLGLSPCRVTRNNPLDFPSRKKMLEDVYPDLGVYYVKDCVSDQLWSNRLDKMIGDHTKPEATVTLYGGRDAFISHYHGKHQTTELEQEVYTSGTEIRNAISNTVPKSPDFRAGVIWASHNQYPKAIPTVAWANAGASFTPSPTIPVSW